ncbi:MAG: tRNA lysidine(34) synthetase TilS [Candidatus Omnitrophica bacterium]|nr:tRNA lysidine(34) synthetase TilS [Candidatus Omnitrophota bacterium]
MKSKIDSTGYFLSKKVGKAITDYQMIQDKDKILVAVSGGKDSLCLLKILQYRQSFVPVKYELLAVHIDMGYRCSQPRILADYFKKEGCKYYIKKIDILKDKKRSSVSCFWCSWNRRRALFETADKFGCTKIALGHHKNDIVETILLNLFFNSEISAMAPKQELFNGKITIIRPLAYVEEKEIISFSRHLNFPHPRCECSNTNISRRNKVARIIKELEKICPNTKSNIFNAIRRVKRNYLL